MTEHWALHPRRAVHRHLTKFVSFAVTSDVAQKAAVLLRQTIGPAQYA